jgi:hypothetical protein
VSIPTQAHYMLFAFWGYLLGKIEKTAADSTIRWGLKRLLKRKTEMKTLLNLGNGALVLTEEGGAFTLTFSDKAALGGGSAAGVVSVQGSGSLVLEGKLAFDLGMKLLEAHSPAALVPLEAAAASIVDGVAASL